MQDQIPFDLIKNVLVIGDNYVGKTSLIIRLAENTFEEEYLPTRHLSFKSKIFQVKDNLCKLQIWDMPVEERFSIPTILNGRILNGIIIVYDVSNRDSFDLSLNHLFDIQQTIDRMIPYQQMIQYMLIGAKIDLTARQVSFEEGLYESIERHVMFSEISSLSSENVQAAFVQITEQMIEYQSTSIIQENLLHHVPTKRYNCI